MRAHFAALLLGLFFAGAAGAQQADSSLLTVQRIYGSSEFKSQTFGPARWLGDGSSYTTLEEADEAGGRMWFVTRRNGVGERS